MSDFYRFGSDLRELLSGFLAIKREEETPKTFIKRDDAQPKHFEENFFFGELNRFVGSGGEILVKGKNNEGTPPTRIDVGDSLIGIGATHLVESLSRPPGPDSIRATNRAALSRVKKALRAFKVEKKEQVSDGFNFHLAPLSPKEYSELVEKVSDGLVRISPDTIPEGTMIISFIDLDYKYTLQTIEGSPSVNWREATTGERHWNVGVGNSTDFWFANFPSDDIGILSQIPSSTRVGSIRFGLSLLPGSKGVTKLNLVPCIGPSGVTTTHHFCLSGTAAGTQGLNTPFPIGLRTEIIFHPES